MKNNIKRIRLVKKENANVTTDKTVHMISICCDDSSMYETSISPSYIKFAYSTLTINQETKNIIPFDINSKYGLFYCYGTNTLYDNITEYINNVKKSTTSHRNCIFRIYLDCTNFNYVKGAVDTFIHLRDKLKRLSISSNDVVLYYDVLNHTYLHDIMDKPSPFKKADIVAKATEIACNTDINNCAQNDINLALAQAKSILVLHYLEKVIDF